MSPKHRSRSVAAPPAAHVHDDDGVPPSRSEGRRHRDTANRTRQLCGRVARIVGSLLAGECHDDVLRDVLVGAVTPAPDASRLCVALHVDTRAVDPSVVRDRVERVRGFLRREVASAVQRKRAPELVFAVLPLDEVSS